MSKSTIMRCVLAIGILAISFMIEAEGAERLTWAPPLLTNPTTINLGTADTVPTLTAGQDYIIKLPAAVRTKRVMVQGGRNVVIMGGQVQVAANDNAFYVLDGDPNRIVHIEGCLVTTGTNTEGDAINICAPNSVVQIQNVRVEHLHGAVDQTNHVHSDIIQTWGGSKELRVDHLTGSSNYQGIFLPANYNRNKRFIFKNVNMTAEEEWFGGAGGGYMVWLDNGNDGDKSGPVPTWFTNVYVKPRVSRPLEISVFPDAGNYNNDSQTFPIISDNFLTWPGLSWVTGGIYHGNPPGGDFVPAGTAGLHYVSPGYNEPPGLKCIVLPSMNDSNQETTAIGESTYIDMAVKLENESEQDKKAVMLIGIYDQEKLFEVIKVTPNNAAVPSYETIVLEKRIPMNRYPGIKKIEMFIWEDVGTMKPIAKKTTIVK